MLNDFGQVGFATVIESLLFYMQVHASACERCNQPSKHGQEVWSRSMEMSV